MVCTGKTEESSASWVWNLLIKIQHVSASSTLILTILSFNLSVTNTTFIKLQIIAEASLEVLTFLLLVVHLWVCMLWAVRTCEWCKMWAKEGGPWVKLFGRILLRNSCCCEAGLFRGKTKCGCDHCVLIMEVTWFHSQAPFLL